MKLIEIVMKAPTKDCTDTVLMTIQINFSAHYPAMQFMATNMNMKFIHTIPYLQ